MYYFIELAGSITNIALLSLFMSRLFVRNKIQSKWHYTFLTLLCTGQCVLSLFPNWVIPRTLYLLLGGFLLARLFYEVQTWPAAFASGSFFVLGSVVEILAMLSEQCWIPRPLWKVLASGQLARNGRQSDLYGRSPLRRCPLRIDARTPDHPAGGV